MADNGTVIDAFGGDEIVVRLRENPATGYRWHVDRVDGVSGQVTDSYTLDANMQFGSGGVREFRFRGTAPGTARLELKRWREWEGEDSVLERFVADVRFAG
ncbi:MAG: protease inhibitor I42 family protein [Chloroflexota bacterium]|nr:protease inhibitor I42 family protein [Chloroflexota bacterium]